VPDIAVKAVYGFAAVIQLPAVVQNHAFVDIKAAGGDFIHKRAGQAGIDKIDRRCTGAARDVFAIGAA
jgi:hypothetical protein